jgi:ribosome biogenesis GTPase
LAAKRSGRKGKTRKDASRKHHNKPSLSSLEESTLRGPGLIVGHYGIAVEVLFDEGPRQLVRTKRNSGHLVGDRVQVEDDGIRRDERRTELQRRDTRGKIHAVAANLDSLGIIVAPRPAPPSGFVDCAIIAARSANIAPFIVLNKNDLEECRALEEELRGDYAQRLPFFSTSTKTDAGIRDLRDFFAHGHRAAFIGTTGVGKSSLLNSLCPDIDLEVKDIDPSSGLGRHTTTTATLHRLPEGGEIIDTPGFRDIRPADLNSSQLATYFLGFEGILQEGCRFANCLHRSEPQCCVRNALAEGALSESSYQQYLSILEDLLASEREQNQRGNA